MMLGYYGKPENQHAWRWKSSRRYNYWAVDVYDDNDGEGTYGDHLVSRTKRESEAIANALNEAYARGIERGRAEGRREAEDGASGPVQPAEAPVP